MAESLRTRLFRWGLNLWPCSWGTGARVTFIASDWREVRVRLPLSWRTRNYVGTIFGGSLYAAVDPFYMIMLMKNLGPGVAVWDKAAAIRFRRPGRTALTATFRLDEAELMEVRHRLAVEPKLDRSYTIQLLDSNGVLHAEVEKLIYLSRSKSS